MGTILNLYSDRRWRATRRAAIARDEGRCTVARLLGGECSKGPLEGHHIMPVSEGGAPFDIVNVGTTCASHHPVWEALRRNLVRQLREPAPVVPRCPHQHRNAEARAQCERRLARQARQRQLVA